LHAEFIALRDIVADLPPVFERFYGKAEHSTCRRCGYRETRAGANET
jgi:3-hydroxyanthranilate 3,4-dioxygenase